MDKNISITRYLIVFSQSIALLSAMIVVLVSVYAFKIITTPSLNGSNVLGVSTSDCLEIQPRVYSSINAMYYNGLRESNNCR